MSELQIDADFPGGNVVVDGVAGDVVRLHPDLRDTEGHWFYWCCRVRVADDLPFGQSWNATANYGGFVSASRWFAVLPGVRLVTSFEIPYANCGGATVDAASARAFGRDLAEAMRRYLET